MVGLADDAIRRQIEQELGFDSLVNGFDVRVQVLNGTVTLEGIVPSLAAKRVAGDIAASVPGVRRVLNGLTVEDPHGLTDPAIEGAVTDALAHDPVVDPGDVGAVVTDGTAHLVGHVDSAAEEEAAIRAASRAPGVKDIVSELDVAPGWDVDWTDLRNQVVEALDNDAHLVPYGIEVDVETDGRIRLTGEVDDEASRARAEQIALRVEGVKDVVNRLRVRT